MKKNRDNIVYRDTAWENIVILYFSISPTPRPHAVVPRRKQLLLRFFMRGFPILIPGSTRSGNSHYINVHTTLSHSGEA